MAETPLASRPDAEVAIAGMGVLVGLLIAAAAGPPAEAFRDYAAGVVLQLEAVADALRQPSAERGQVREALTEVSLTMRDFYRRYGAGSDWSDGQAASIDRELFQAVTWYDLATDYRFRSREEGRFTLARTRGDTHLTAAKSALAGFTRGR